MGVGSVATCYYCIRAEPVEQSLLFSFSDVFLASRVLLNV